MPQSPVPAWHLHLPILGWTRARTTTPGTLSLTTPGILLLTTPALPLLDCPPSCKHSLGWMAHFCFVFTTVKNTKDFTIKLSVKNDSCYEKAQGEARLGAPAIFIIRSVHNWLLKTANYGSTHDFSVMGVTVLVYDPRGASNKWQFIKIWLDHYYATTRIHSVPHKIDMFFTFLTAILTIYILTI
ncbi:hypothetical protein BC827DRAFT_1151496 [Russula dissimulans]|nr:hypothetical protein BC827DRAFT_1151496 [Russula dissimulans]